jgi:spermidine synthase
MKPWTTLDRAPAPGGGELLLQERDGTFVIRVHGTELMSSRTHGSEEAMARLAFEDRVMPATPKVLVGGLGMGFTVRAALDVLPPSGKVVIAELSEAVVRWNKGPLADLARRPLEDPRIRIERVDVLGLLKQADRAYDAILLDIDNGPSALAAPGNASLYASRGIAACHQALRSGGALVVWSAGPDERYLLALEKAGLDARARTVTAHTTGGRRHTLFVARKRRA